jgi:hypothetical protein
MEKARMVRANDQAEDRDPAVRTANRPNRKVRMENAVVAVPARVKAGVAVADKDRAVAQDAVAVKTVEIKFMQNCDLSSLDQ